MDRLTVPSILGGWTTSAMKQEVVDYLAAYEDAEEQGRLMVIDKPLDVWDFIGNEFGELIDVIEELDLSEGSKDHLRDLVRKDLSLVLKRITDIGQAAEAALKEMEADNGTD